MDSFYSLFQETLLLAIKVALPLLLAVFLSGSLFSFVGNFFQIRDGSFVQIPKLFLIALVILLFLPWQWGLLSDYFRQMLSSFYMERF